MVNLNFENDILVVVQRNMEEEVKRRFIIFLFFIDLFIYYLYFYFVRMFFNNIFFLKCFRNEIRY